MADAALDKTISEDLSVHSENWVRQIPMPICPNCRAVCDTAFCGGCGQKQLVQRLRFGGLIKDLFAKVTDVDRGLFFTFWAMLIRPGQVAKDYVRGKQKVYVNPLTFFFIGAAIQLLGLWICEGELRSVIKEQFTTQREQQPNIDRQMTEIESRVGKPADQFFADSYIGAMQQGYTYAALLFFSLPFAVMLFLLHRIIGSEFYLGETVVFSLYVFGQILIITAISLPLALFIFGPILHGILSMFVYLIFPMHAHRRFFPPGFVSRAMTLMALLVSTATFGGSILVISVISMRLAG
ncbi:MAG: DUF3667 domain-containing protein [Planctomycetota bacterium]